MSRTKSTPPVPRIWLLYIKKQSRKYAVAMIDRDDVEQIGREAFLKARERYDPKKGPFEHYAKVAINNALLNARIAEQRFWGTGTPPTDDAGLDAGPDPLWAAEDIALDAIIQRDVDASIAAWRQRLSAPAAAVVEALYYRDLSQRDFAAEQGVTQARISQRNGEMLTLARRDLKHLRH